MIREMNQSNHTFLQWPLEEYSYDRTLVCSPLERKVSPYRQYTPSWIIYHHHHLEWMIIYMEEQRDHHNNKLIMIWVIEDNTCLSSFVTAETELKNRTRRHERRQEEAASFAIVVNNMIKITVLFSSTMMNMKRSLYRRKSYMHRVKLKESNSCPLILSLIDINCYY